MGGLSSIVRRSRSAGLCVRSVCVEMMALRVLIIIGLFLFPCRISCRDLLFERGFMRSGCKRATR